MIDKELLITVCNIEFYSFVSINKSHAICSVIYSFTSHHWITSVVRIMQLISYFVLRCFHASAYICMASNCVHLQSSFTYLIKYANQIEQTFITFDRPWHSVFKFSKETIPKINRIQKNVFDLIYNYENFKNKSLQYWNKKHFKHSKWSQFNLAPSKFRIEKNKCVWIISFHFFSLLCL